MGTEFEGNFPASNSADGDGATGGGGVAFPGNSQNMVPYRSDHVPNFYALVVFTELTCLYKYGFCCADPLPNKLTSVDFIVLTLYQTNCYNYTHVTLHWILLCKCGSYCNDPLPNQQTVWAQVRVWILLCRPFTNWTVC